MYVRMYVSSSYEERIEGSGSVNKTSHLTGNKKRIQLTILSPIYAKARLTLLVYDVASAW